MSVAARKPFPVGLVVLCALVWIVALGAAPAGAVTQFGGLRGTNSGEFANPLGVAIDQESGDIYVADANNRRVDKFEGTGRFLQAWGWGVNQVDPANALQICTASCQLGQEGAGTGEFGSAGPRGIAVDNDPSSTSRGDVYVADIENDRVEKFTPSGEFVLMFGGGVNAKTGKDVCIAGEQCQAGTPGTADGQFEWSYQGSHIAVGPGGAVYVGDRARIQVFSPSGEWRENISLADLSSINKVSALAVNAAGDMFVKDEGVPGVREFEPTGLEAMVSFDTASETIEALALNESGDLFVADSGGGFRILEYAPEGEQLASFASRTPSLVENLTLATSGGMAFSNKNDELYVGGESEAVIRNAETFQAEEVWVLAPPPPGPVILAGSETAVPATRGAATFEASVNPEGRETTVYFEYADEADYQAEGFGSATSTPTVSIGSSYEEQPVRIELTGLTPGVTYHYRVVAGNVRGTATGSDQSFEEDPSARVDGPWAEDIASTSVTLAASVDPLGVSTEYRLEYGPSAAYGHVLSGNVGEGMTSVPIAYHLQELQPSTTYHYRLVTVNEVGTVQGADHTFNTQTGSGEELGLPDGRAWELVSPPNKHGSIIGTYALSAGTLIQAASDGSAIAYPSEGPALGENAQGRTIVSVDLSRRNSTGWSTTDIDTPRRTVKEEEAAYNLIRGTFGGIPAFSPDLSLALIEPSVNATPALSTKATERTVYIRENATGSYLPLVTPADVAPGAKFGGEASTVEGGKLEMRFAAGTPDLSHVIIQSPLALIPPAIAAEGCGEQMICPLPEENLYEWSDGQLQLVNVLPDEQATRETSGAHNESGALLAGETEGHEGLAPRPISADGRWVAWTWDSPYGITRSNYKGLYVRDMVAHKTFQVGGLHALYQMMSSDGSRIFFREEGELYEFETATDTQTDLTAAHGAGEETSGVKEGVSDISEDGSYVYFVATGVLAAGATGGEDNLYLLHESGGKWSTTFIATLSPEDENSWYSGTLTGGVNLSGISSRVSPDGRYLAFMSSRPLTGYDNLDANSGQPDEEVYLYDAATKRLICASCNPTGARPVGIFDSNNEPLVDPLDFWGLHSQGEAGHWLAGSIPGWTYVDTGNSLYQTRYLGDSGRLFFNSADALVPQDTDDLEDVYEYEPSGIDGCTAATASFSERSGGCVSLISSGTSSQESVFYDASESGDDVFFLTASRLTAADYDDSYDIYDAHVCSAALPCAAEPVSPPPCTSGDSCKAAPSPQPAIFGAPPSATFSGAGNIIPETTTATEPRVKRLSCRKGFTKKHGKCVRRKAKIKARAKKAGDKRRTK